MKLLQTTATLLLTLLIGTPVSALTVDLRTEASASTSAADVSVSAAMQERIDTGKNRADQEIARRIDALNQLNTRIQAMTKLTTTEKATLDTSINTQVSTLTALKAKIDADSDITTLKTDVKSITESYRIFMLIIPQGRITVASDKLKSAAEVEAALAAKLTARIDADTAAGKDTAAEKKALADMQAKIADANIQADAAVALVANLSPDGGDKAKATANAQALKDARAKIKMGLKDIVSARDDARTIVKGLAINASGSAAASTTTP